MPLVHPRPAPVIALMHALLVSTGIVAVSEIGDKTQLLALLLASRFGRPGPIILGMLAATLLNHALAALAGAWVAGAVPPELLRWGLALCFLAMAVWALIPDTLDERRVVTRAGGAFVTTALCFFLAELGDKTQLATAALAAKFDIVLPVVAGTTLGMMLADVPAVLLGHAAGHRVNTKWVRRFAAVLAAALAAMTLSGVSLPEGSGRAGSVVDFGAIGDTMASGLVRATGSERSRVRTPPSLSPQTYPTPSAACLTAARCSTSWTTPPSASLPRGRSGGAMRWARSSSAWDLPATS
jgi:Ca2+/H+ antiporter, TMEM165/GDT1 family